MRKIITYTFLLLHTILYSEQTKYTLSACSIFKNEAKYIKEWIEYHKMVGVEHFYLYNIRSSDQYLKSLKIYIEEGVVTLIEWPKINKENEIENWMLGTEIPAYENAAKYQAIGKSKWLVFIDINEFLVPPSSSKLTDVLEKYDDFPAIILEREFFDASTTTSAPKRKLVIESLDLAIPPNENPQKKIEKTIFKPDCVECFTWPPYKFFFKDNKSPIILKKKEIQINTYINRKVKKNEKKSYPALSMDHRLLSDEKRDEFLKMGYRLEDQERAIYRFIPQLFEKIESAPSWIK